MDFRPFGKIARLSRECVVTEKIDGTNAQVNIEQVPLRTMTVADPSIIASRTRPITQVVEFMRIGSRTRWITPEDDNFGFARWCKEHSEELFELGPGAHFGEWWGCGINRGYGLKEKRFSLFNTHKWGEESDRPVCCGVVPVLHEGIFRTDHIEAVVERLREIGSAAAPGFMNPEGIIVYHEASKTYFKKTIKNDDNPKGQADV